MQIWRNILINYSDKLFMKVKIFSMYMIVNIMRPNLVFINKIGNGCGHVYKVIKI